MFNLANDECIAYLPKQQKKNQREKKREMETTEEEAGPSSEKHKFCSHQNYGNVFIDDRCRPPSPLLVMIHNKYNSNL